MKNITINTYSQIYQDYAQRNVMNDNLQPLLDKYISLMSGKKILDIGCANGRDAYYFLDKGFDVYGIDLTPEFIDLAKQDCPQGNFQVMDMRSLNFPEHSFDGLWACASFLHIPKKEALKTLQGFRRVIKEAGILYLSVMSGDSEGYRKNEKLKWGDRYFSFYQKDELKELMQQAGFETVQLVETPTSWGPVFLNGYWRAS